MLLKVCKRSKKGEWIWGTLDELERGVHAGRRGAKIGTNGFGVGKGKDYPV